MCLKLIEPYLNIAVAFVIDFFSKKCTKNTHIPPLFQ